MSGKYLHGLLIDGNYIEVIDNVFSHSELRQVMTQREKKHPMIQEWSWDYVTREFQETPDKIIPILQKWINKNLFTYEQLITWIDRNWEGLVNSDEFERELYIWRLLQNPKHPDTKINRFLKADSDWEKAYSDWKKADSDWEKADSDWKKTYSDWKKADKRWKTQIMKPIFLELLRKFPNKHWKKNRGKR